MSRSQTKRPRDAARLATHQDAAAPAITAPGGAPARQQNAGHPDHLIPTGADHSADAPDPTPATALVPIGAGFDTSRYGHYLSIPLSHCADDGV